MGHRDEAVAEGLEVTLLQALLFFQSLAARPVKALQAEGAGGRESGRRNDTTQHITTRRRDEDSAPLLTCPINPEPVPGS